MKNGKLERMDNDLFGKFEEHKLNDLASTQLKGGATTTTLCSTTEAWNDSDSNSSGEDLSDARCTGAIQ